MSELILPTITPFSSLVSSSRISALCKTALLCSWLMYLLAYHPEIQQELHEEVDRFLEEENAGPGMRRSGRASAEQLVFCAQSSMLADMKGNFKFPSWEALEKWEYGSCVFREVRDGLA